MHESARAIAFENPVVRSVRIRHSPSVWVDRAISSRSLIDTGSLSTFPTPDRDFTSVGLDLSTLTDTTCAVKPPFSKLRLQCIFRGFFAGNSPQSLLP